MPACCSPSVMPGGSDRNAIAEQAGGAFWVGGLAGAAPANAGRLRAKPIPTASVLLIVNSSSRQWPVYSPARCPAVELIHARRRNCHADGPDAAGGFSKRRGTRPRARRRRVCERNG